MSDTSPDRPDDATPDVSAGPAPDAPQNAAAPLPSAESAAEAAPVEGTVPAEPTAPVVTAHESAAPVVPPMPPVPPAFVAPGAPAGPVASAPSAPGSAPTGTPAQPVPPRAPGYAGQAPAYPQQYAGQPPYGAAFGAAPRQATQPTLPLQPGPYGAAGQPMSPATGAQPTAAKPASTAGRTVGLILAAALVGGAAGLGGAYAGVNLFSSSGQVTVAAPSTVTVNDTDSVNQTTGIAAKVLPSVVTIEASGSGGTGTGSGVILTEDGYIVTNTHVVTLDGATGDAAVRVTTSDGRVLDAEIIGLDPTYDLAVIKVDGAEGLTPIEFADSSALNVGDVAVAVGAPLGLSNTVTTGIISALNRSIEIASAAAPDTDAEEEDTDPGQEQEGELPPFFFDYGQGRQPSASAESIKIAVIQTDAAINPGNSGGALVDSEGRLIGINVAIASAGGASGQAGSIGVGFSIPSDIVQRITDELIEDGEATHGLLGANVQSAAYVEGTSITGAYIAEVIAGGAAAAAGLQQGDIVTQFNGVPINDSVDLTAQVRAAAAGSDATVTVVRDGVSRTFDVTLGSLP
jgi:putative serine protease PepD